MFQETEKCNLKSYIYEVVKIFKTGLLEVGLDLLRRKKNYYKAVVIRRLSVVFVYQHHKGQ